MTFQFGVRWAIPELLRGLHQAGGIDLPALNGEESWTLPIPACFVVDRNGDIVYSEINPDQNRLSDRRNVAVPADAPGRSAARLRHEALRKEIHCFDGSC